MFSAAYNVGRADRIEARLVSRAASLASVPGQGRPIGDGVRRLSLPDIQLVLHYRVLDDEDAIRIIRVVHTRENKDSL